MLRRKAFAGGADDAHVRPAARVLIDVACSLGAAGLLAGAIVVPGSPIAIGLIVKAIAGISVAAGRLRRDRWCLSCRDRGNKRPNVGDGILKPLNRRLDDRFGSLVV